jgi:hypothetical protein
MTKLFKKLSKDAKPYEVAVGRTIHSGSKYTYIEEINVPDYDVFLSGSDKNIKVEVKVHAGADKMGSHYPTMCVEIKEYSYRTKDYEWSHWLSSNFDIIAHVDKSMDTIHLYNGHKFRQWALARKHTARQAKYADTKFITSPWVNQDAGYLMTLPFSSGSLKL